MSCAFSWLKLQYGTCFLQTRLAYAWLAAYLDCVPIDAWGRSSSATMHVAQPIAPRSTRTAAAALAAGVDDEWMVSMYWDVTHVHRPVGPELAVP